MGYNSSIPRVRSLSQYEEIMAVQMDWMRDGNRSIDQQVDPFIGMGKLDNTTRHRETGGIVVNLEQCGILPGNLHTGAVQVPAEQILGVFFDCHIFHGTPVCIRN